MQTRTAAPDPREQRRQRILELVGSRPIRSQAELQELLEHAGHGANQATLSRDLRDLGVVKGRFGYELPQGGGPGQTPGTQGLWQAVHAWLLDATAAQNLLVLRTPPSGAQPLALALDRAAEDPRLLPGLVGTIAGDDTVLAICADAAKARSLCRRLLAHKERVA